MPNVLAEIVPALTRICNNNYPLTKQTIIHFRFLLALKKRIPMSALLHQVNQQLNKIATEIQSFVKDRVNELALQDNQSSLHQLKMVAALKLVSRFVGLSIPFASRNGFQVIAFKPGYVKAFMPLKGNKNHFNAMYAGALFTVAEIPGGIISIFNFSEAYYPVLKNLKIEFIKMAKSDVTVEFSVSNEELSRLQEEADRLGKSEFSLQGEVKDAQGEVVAISYAEYQLRKH